MKRILSLIGCAALMSIAANVSTPTARAADAEGAPDYRPFTLGLEAGTTGFGGSGNWRFADHWGVRAGFDYFQHSDSGDEFMGVKIEIVDGQVPEPNFLGYATINKKYRLMSEPLGLDIYPWKKSSFRITVGIMLNQNEVEGVVPQDPVFGNTFLIIGGNRYDSANIGDLNMKLEQNLVAPYVSVGMSFYLDRQKHWSLGGELGVAYTGTPDVTLSTSKGQVPQPDLDAEAQQIKDDAWKFYPIVKVSVNYSF